MKNIFATLVVTVLSVTAAMAQTSFIVQTEKPGQLEKKLNCNDFNSINKLTISGVIGNKDILTISRMTNLTELSLTNVTFDHKKDVKLGFISEFTEEITLPSLPKLKRLSILLLEQNNGKLQATTRIKASDMNLLKCLTLTSSISLEFADGQAIALDSMVSVPDGSLQHMIPLYNEQYQESGNLDYLLNEYAFYFGDRPQSLGQYIQNCSLTTKVWTVAHKEIIDTGLGRNYETVPFPFIIHSTETGKNTLNVWNSCLSAQDLESIDELGFAAYNSCSLDSVTIPSKVKKIPRFCFAFSKIKKVTIPSSVTQIEEKAFDNSDIEQVYMLSQTAPSFYGNDSNGKINTIEFFIPQNSEEYYSVGNWKKLTKTQSGERKLYAFDIRHGGTLSQYITDENASSIMDLKIRGLLYDTDIPIICKCTNLRNLDLEFAFITLSPETMEKKHRESVALASLFRDLGVLAQADAQNQFSHGFMNALQYQNNTQIGQFFEVLGSIGMAEGIDTTSVPFSRLDLGELKSLESLVCPRYITDLSGNTNSPRLKNVVLPPQLKILGMYFERSNIQTINFPSTLEKIKEYVRGFDNLTELDLRNTNVSDMGFTAFSDCSNIKKVSLGEKQANFRGKLPEVRGCVYYCYGIKERPVSFFAGSNSEIHIPRGFRAGWSDYENNSSCTLIDDL